MDRIGKTLAPILIWRRKAEVLRQLPKRIDNTIFVPMMAEQQAHHEENADTVARIVRRWRKTGYLSDIDQRVLAAIVLTGMIAALVSTYLGLNSVTIEDSSQWNALFGWYFFGFAVIILASIPAFVLPFAFVTGVRMYLIDQKLFGTELEWDDVLLIYAFTFFGAVAFALFPTMLFGVVIAGSADEIPRALSIAPWALPTAFVALGYFVFSEFKLPIHKGAQFVLDLAVHAVPAAFLAWAALQISTSPTPKAPLTFVFKTLPPMPPELLEPSVMMSAGILGGVLGAIQCAISRQ